MSAAGDAGERRGGSDFDDRLGLARRLGESDVRRGEVLDLLLELVVLALELHELGKLLLRLLGRRRRRRGRRCRALHEALLERGAALSPAIALRLELCARGVVRLDRDALARCGRRTRRVGGWRSGGLTRRVLELADALQVAEKCVNTTRVFSSLFCVRLYARTRDARPDTRDTARDASRE